MEDNYIEKTIAKLDIYLQLYSRKAQIIEDTIAVIRALPAEAASRSLFGELSGACGPVSEAMSASGQDLRQEHTSTGGSDPEKAGARNQYKGVSRRTQKTGKAASNTEKTGETKKRKPGPKPGKSQFHGVRKKVARGKIRFECTVWDTKKQKAVYIGVFDSEIEAAIAVAEYKGDSAETARLRQLAEGEPVPDEHEQAAAIEKLKGRIAIECLECGQDYDSTPDKCGKCGSSSFHTFRIPAAADPKNRSHHQYTR